MATYFRIKEITAPATVLRQSNLLMLELGDFIYPEEIDTIACDANITYWDDRTGEQFTWTPSAKTLSVPKQAPVQVVPAPLETGSENTKA